MASIPSQESLERRVAELRDSSPASNEFVDAVWCLAAALWFEPERLEALAREALEVAERNEYRLGRARCQLVIAETQYVRVRYGQIMTHLREALPVFVEIGSRHEYAWCMLILAAVSQMAGSYDEALEQCLKGRNAAAEVTAEEVHAWLHYRTADVYRELGDNERMFEYARQCRDEFEALYPRSLRRQHRIGVGRAKTLLGAANFARGDLDEAHKLNLEALAVYREVEDQLGETRALSDIGQIYLKKGDLDKAEQHLRESMEIRERLGHRASLASNLLTLGEIYMLRGLTDEALTTFHDMLTIASEGGIKMRAYQAHEALARVFQASGYSDRALIHYRKYHDLKEEAAGEAMNLRVHNMKILSDIAAAEREAELQRQKSLELQSKNEELAALLAKLKATQDRLIQSEKMASLGQLTAGIAHEIRNPLNFVNNFAELTRQLVGEIEEVLAEHIDSLPEDLKEEFDDFLETLKFNSTKIQDHGKRADRIVQSMLEHSRGGQSQRVRTDLNRLVDECLNLAYHGMRARSIDFNVTIERDLQEGLPEIEVVSQDIGRVFLNILSNAFDALYGSDTGRAPLIKISTQAQDGEVEIRIEDNGPGMPDHVRARIFEPFFTTKPTGSGTGLGLSLAYDIVTKGHGGMLEAQPAAGGGAAFIVRLPAQT